MPGGHGQPDAAAIIGAIEGSTGTTLRQNTGKPDPFMIEAALDRMQLAAADCVMVGDRLMTDIRMGIDAGMSTALVLTGETTPDMLRSPEITLRPTWVLERVDELLPQSHWDRMAWTRNDP